MKPKKILIIDDSQDDVLIAERVISRLKRGVRTEVARSGEEGLALLAGEETLPALILLDIKMPGMDGVEVLRRIRGNLRLGDIPVIIVTHSALDSDVDACCEAGANAVLHKAFDIDRFGKEIEAVLERWL
ncbi:MAG: response regulator [Candidatus Sulfobium sp.]